ncbi:MAG: hypothetical protein FGM32_10950 [Candidatus Kapabacteria bacterium]|nr:hypothetical protein [Candidatus Kapabacteria bacterium]
MPLQPYQYAGNEPVGKYDNNGKHIVGLRAEDKAYLATSMKTHYGVDVSFTERAAMVISSEQMQLAKHSNDPDSYSQLVNINEMAQDQTKVLNVAAISGTNVERTGIGVGGADQDGNSARHLEVGVETGPGASEFFVSTPARPNNAWIIIRPDITNSETYSAEGNQKTKECGTCVLVHALLDHAMQWFLSGSSNTRIEGVANHNTALVNKAGSVPRDGKDHTNDGSQK